MSNFVLHFEEDDYSVDNGSLAIECHNMTLSVFVYVYQKGASIFGATPISANPTCSYKFINGTLLPAFFGPYKLFTTNTTVPILPNQVRLFHTRELITRISALRLGAENLAWNSHRHRSIRWYGHWRFSNYFFSFIVKRSVSLSTLFLSSSYS